ncbi:hypothetical protein VNO80_05231 [Phaseolus coccineus]|uniref:Uncharacterized protein n=1 Tax=Phaseolus coccineus TaxID=3886 RepID=A0AAN9NEQ5_PHACN
MKTNITLLSNQRFLHFQTDGDCIRQRCRLGYTGFKIFSGCKLDGNRNENYNNRNIKAEKESNKISCKVRLYHHQLHPILRYLILSCKKHINLYRLMEEEKDNEEHVLKRNRTGTFEEEGEDVGFVSGTEVDDVVGGVAAEDGGNVVEVDTQGEGAVAAEVVEGVGEEEEEGRRRWPCGRSSWLGGRSRRWRSTRCWHPAPGNGSLFARVVSHKKLLPFDINGVPEYRPRVFPFLYDKKSLQACPSFIPSEVPLHLVSDDSIDFFSILNPKKTYHLAAMELMNLGLCLSFLSFYPCQYPILRAPLCVDYRLDMFVLLERQKFSARNQAHFEMVRPLSSSPIEKAPLSTGNRSEKGSETQLLNSDSISGFSSVGVNPLLGETMFVLLYKGGVGAGYGGDRLGAYGCAVEGYGTCDGPNIGGVYESANIVSKASSHGKTKHASKLWLMFTVLMFKCISLTRITTV